MSVHAEAETASHYSSYHDLTHHRHSCCFFLFFFNDTATTEIYTLSLHDALPIFEGIQPEVHEDRPVDLDRATRHPAVRLIDEPVLEVDQPNGWRSEEHTSELQSLAYLVCRLLLEKKKIMTSQ